MEKKGSAGGKVMAIRQREDAIANYYLNPNRCITCNSVIEVTAKSKVSEIRKKKFCGHSCSAKYSNRNRVRSNTPKIIYAKKCIICGTEVSTNRSRYCIACNTHMPNHNTLTIADLLITGNGHKHRRIRDHSRRIYMESTKPKACTICGYAIHFEVCHIVPVCKFSVTTTISVVNNIDNLIALCPNHHWEMDNGLI